MFELTTTSTEVTLFNHCIAKMQSAAVRLAGATDDFKTPYADLPESYKPFVGMLTAEYCSAADVLHKMDAKTASIMIQSLIPETAVYVDDVIYQCQIIVVTDEALHKRLKFAKERSAAWADKTSANKKLSELEQALEKKLWVANQGGIETCRTNPAAHPDGAAEDQSEAAA